MIKKLVALAATALFSMNASAGYVRYDLSGPNVAGYFFQNEEDRSIAGYYIDVDTGEYGVNLEPNQNVSNLSWTKTGHKNQGPSRFAVFSYVNEWVATNMWFNFSSTDNPDVFNFRSRFSAVQWYHDPDWDPPVNIVLHPSGTATRSAVDPDVAANFDLYLEVTGAYPDGLRHIVPRLNEVPEPGSIALFTLGVAGLTGASRRRKALK